MTQEQLELMYQHYRLDNPSPTDENEDGKARDSSYDEEEGSLAKSKSIEEEGLPIEDNESYKDPDFMDEWNSLDEEVGEDPIPNMELIGENPSEEGFLDVGEGNVSAKEGDISIHNKDGWAEVD